MSEKFIKWRDKVSELIEAFLEQYCKACADTSEASTDIQLKDLGTKVSMFHKDSEILGVSLLRVPGTERLFTEVIIPNRKDYPMVEEIIRALEDDNTW